MDTVWCLGAVGIDGELIAKNLSVADTRNEAGADAETVARFSKQSDIEIIAGGEIVLENDQRLTARLGARSGLTGQCRAGRPRRRRGRHRRYRRR